MTREYAIDTIKTLLYAGGLMPEDAEAIPEIVILFLEQTDVIDKRRWTKEEPA